MLRPVLFSVLIVAATSTGVAQSSSSEAATYRKLLKMVDTFHPDRFKAIIEYLPVAPFGRVGETEQLLWKASIMTEERSEQLMAEAERKGLAPVAAELRAKAERIASDRAPYIDILRFSGNAPGFLSSKREPSRSNAKAPGHQAGSSEDAGSTTSR